MVWSSQCHRIHSMKVTVETGDGGKTMVHGTSPHHSHQGGTPSGQFCCSVKCARKITRVVKAKGSIKQSQEVCFYWLIYLYYNDRDHDQPLFKQNPFKMLRTCQEFFLSRVPLVFKYVTVQLIWMNLIQTWVVVFFFFFFPVPCRQRCLSLATEVICLWKLKSWRVVL